jgi:hypothetical protein
MFAAVAGLLESEFLSQDGRLNGLSRGRSANDPRMLHDFSQSVALSRVSPEHALQQVASLVADWNFQVGQQFFESALGNSSVSFV